SSKASRGSFIPASLISSPLHTSEPDAWTVRLRDSFLPRPTRRQARHPTLDPRTPEGTARHRAGVPGMSSGMAGDPARLRHSLVRQRSAARVRLLDNFGQPDQARLPRPSGDDLEPEANRPGGHPQGRGKELHLAAEPDETDLVAKDGARSQISGRLPVRVRAGHRLYRTVVGSEFLRLQPWWDLVQDGRPIVGSSGHD